LFREHAKTTKTSADLPENVIRVLAIKVNSVDYYTFVADYYRK